MRWILAALACLAVLSSAAAADNANDPRYALIVGASGYTAVPALNGPRNDVTLMVNTLLDAGVPRSHIRVLADRLETAQYARRVIADGDPSHDEIITGLDWLAGVSTGSTQALIMFSGHGTQFPVEPSESEPDGFDEVFLPVDVAATNAPGVYLERALKDDELAPKLQAITARGAFLWFISDSCNSGTLSRAGDAGRVARYVDPAAFGVSPSLIAQTKAKAAAGRFASSTTSDAPSGRFVGFYAAQPHQVTYEDPIDVPDAAGAPRVHGEFTWNIVRGLQSGGFKDYSSLAQRVLSEHFLGGHGEVSPMFEGALSQTPMIGAGGVQTFALGVEGKVPVLRAGWVNGVEAGTLVEIRGGGGEGRQAGRARLASVQAAMSRLDFIGGVEALDRDFVTAWADPEMGLTQYRVRIVERPLSFVTRVAQPAAAPGVRLTPADQGLMERTRKILEDAIRRPLSEQLFALEIAGPGQSAEVYPIIANGRVWLFRKGDALTFSGVGRPLSLDATLSGDALLSALRVMSKTANLLRVMAAAAAVDRASPLTVETFLRPSGMIGAEGACTAPLRGQIPMVPADAAPAPALPLAVHHCDVVVIKVTNRSSRVLDVSPFYVDQWSQIRLIKPYTGWQRGALQLEPGETRVLSYTENLSSQATEAGRPVGAMQVIVLATPGEAGAPRDYAYLENVMDRTRLGENGFAGLLSRAGFGDGAVRAATVSAQGETGGGVVIPVTTSMRAP